MSKNKRNLGTEYEQFIRWRNSFQTPQKEEEPKPKLLRSVRKEMVRERKKKQAAANAQYNQILSDIKPKIRRHWRKENPLMQFTFEGFPPEAYVLPQPKKEKKVKVVNMRQAARFGAAAVSAENAKKNEARREARKARLKEVRRALAAKRALTPTQMLIP